MTPEELRRKIDNAQLAALEAIVAYLKEGAGSRTLREVDREVERLRNLIVKGKEE